MNKPTAADLVGRNMKSYLLPNKTLWILTIKRRCRKRQLIFLLNTDANMLCRLFDDRKYMDIYLPIH